MIIWITRSTAFSVQCGGLERLHVWFKKPVWRTTWRSPEEDQMPWPPDLSDLNGRGYSSWEAVNSGIGPVSFGKVFGYADQDDAGQNELARFVWGKLCDHFGTADLREFKDTEFISRQNFLLQIDLSIRMI